MATPPSAHRAFAATGGRPATLALGLLSSCALALAPSPGWAQAGGTYAVTTAAGTYVPLAGGTAVGVVSGPKGAGAGATVPLGFAFGFFGTTYDEVYVNTHGQVLFGSQSDAPKAYAGAIGDPAAPNGWVSPWWSSGALSIDAPGDLTWSVAGVAGERVATFQWARWNYNKGKGRSMQVALLEATRTVELRYGPIETGVSYESAVAGAEDPAGAAVGALACNDDVGYARKGCISGKWPAEGTVVSLVWSPLGADLVADAQITGVSDGGAGQLSVAVRARVRNLGAQQATLFGLDWWAGPQAPFDPASWSKVGGHGSPLTLGPREEALVDDVVLVPRPASPELRLAAIVDPADAVDEADEANNTGVSAPQAVGIDLQALSVEGPATAGVGEPAQATVTLFNRGTDAATAEVALYLVSGSTVDPARDREVGRATVTMGGVSGTSVVVAGQVPVDFFGALDERWAAVVDPDRALPDVDRSNDTVVAASTCALRAPDLKIENVAISAGPLFFGEPVEVSFDLANVGEAEARAVTVGVFLSDNTIITLNDRLVGKVEGLQVPVGGRTRVSLATTLPEADGAGRPYAAGAWWLGAIADPMLAIAEVNEANNASPGPELQIRPAAPDLVAVSLEAPLAVAPGERFPVALTVANRGNRPSAAFGVRLGCSLNHIASAEDVALPLLGADGAPVPVSLALAVGESRRLVAFTALPDDAPAGELWLSLLVDPEDAVAELTGDDDAALSGVVAVAHARVAIVDRALPDVLAGAAFTWDLAAAGCGAGCAWGLVEGMGALPPGLSLSAAGRISGTPAAPGVFPFAVEARAADGSADVAAAVVRVFTTTSNLAVATAQLPGAVEGVPYGVVSRIPEGVSLVATGGLPPYVWGLAGWSRLPDGLSLQAGVVAGTPEPTALGSWKVRFAVWDSAGTRAERELALEVRPQGSLTIALPLLPNAEQGRGYAQSIDVDGAVPPVKVELEPGSALPDGLQLSGSAQLPLLFGTPTAAGAWPFVLRASDASGASVSRAFVLLVSAKRLALAPARLADARPGKGYSASLVADLAGAQVSLFGGALPPGLTLSPNGVIAGTVDLDARPVSYDFEAVVRTPTGEAEAAYTIAVLAEPRPLPTSGQASGGGSGAGGGRAAGSGWGWVGGGMVLVLVLGRSKRRKSV